MKVLVLCNDYWHPGKIVEDGLNGLNSDYDFDFYDRVRTVDPTDYSSYDLIILSRGNNLERSEKEVLFNPWITDEIIEKLTSFVELGGSIFGIHSGTAEYNEYPKLKELLGGVFASHPAQCPVSHDVVKFSPMTKGASSFTEMDEHYQMDVTNDFDVFLTSTSPLSTQPAGWTRKQGKGKVCILTPGHTTDIWNNESFKTLLVNCLQWCGE